MIKKLTLAIFVSFSIILVGSNVAKANVNNFQIVDYKINYQLGRDAEGHSTLKTTETITAEFPNYNRNRGIERVIPTHYAGHGVGLEIVSVTNEDGTKLKYQKLNESVGLVLQIGDASKYVHGLQTYVIEYRQKDVTNYFADNNRDEFYWDTNGVGWKVPIKNLTVELNIEESLLSSLTGESACYVGRQGSSTRCEIKNPVDGVYLLEVKNLSAGENLTLAVAFKDQTFSEYVMSLRDKIIAFWTLSQFVIGFIVLIILLVGGRSYYRTKYRVNEQGTIVPEYIPPKDTSISISAILLNAKKQINAAQILDLAVQKYIKIIQTKSGKLFKKNKYLIEITRSIDTLKADEVEILHDMFGHIPEVGYQLDLEEMKKDTTVGVRLMDNKRKFTKLAENTYGLQGVDHSVRKRYQKYALVALIIGLPIINIPLIAMSAIIFIASFTIRPLTDKGLELVRYLKGLKMYINVAEKDRLAMLQSPEGAEKANIDPSDPAQIVKLYERNLPYAVLFGQEKRWLGELGKYYQQINQQPDWYSDTTGGIAAFSALNFASSLSSFTSSYSSAISSSSSSSGSGGGGFSGGGGGGGGGGGW